MDFHNISANNTDLKVIIHFGDEGNYLQRCQKLFPVCAKLGCVSSRVHGDLKKDKSRLDIQLKGMEVKNIAEILNITNEPFKKKCSGRQKKVTI